jgi:DNA (cytosine-5)-methyltransferase 1
MGLDLGLEKTGRFRIIACVEKEPIFCDTIRLNKRAGRLNRELKIFEKDIAELDADEVLSALKLKPGDIDVLVGGPPCQSFSTAGKRGTIQDPRGTLLWQFLRFVDALKPKFFLMENVRGLLSAAVQHRCIAKRPDKGGAPLDVEEKPGSVVRLFADDLQQIRDPYHMDCFEVNAVNYGAPQLRERAFFIGNRFNALVDFPDPTHGPPESGDPVLYPEDVKEPWSTLGDAIGKVYEESPTIMDFSPRKKKYLAEVSSGSNWRSLPLELQKESMGKAWHAKGGRSGWWRRLSFDLPCPTLVTMPNHASTSLCHPTEVRALTVKEYALIQEFPPEWEFAGTAAQQYAQAGNAVPIRLGEKAGEAISAKMDELRDRNWQPCRHKPEAYRVIYVQSHIRTRQWFKGGKTFAWQDGHANNDASYVAPKTRRRSSIL